MKIRQGFISNSSTSSFVILGYLIDETSPLLRRASKELSGTPDTDLMDLIEFFDDEDIAVICHEDNGIPKGKILIGTMLSIIDNDSILERIDLFEHMEKITEIAEILGTKEKPSLFSGIMMT